MNFTEEYERRRSEIDGYLSATVKSLNSYPQALREATAYALLGEGKRLRPVLFLETVRALGASVTPQVTEIAVAIECVHAYSLVHDDLPCMDNDDFRRGKPTVHKKFGEAVALLAGDALLNLAYEKLMRAISRSASAELTEACRLIAFSAGGCGMIGGQACELEKGVTDKTVDYIYSHKTGALIRASVVAGAIVAGASDEVINKLSEFADYFGYCFQLTDDLLDEDGDSDLTTYLSLYGRERTIVRLNEYTEKAVKILSKICGTEFLSELTLNYKNRLK